MENKRYSRFGGSALGENPIDGLNQHPHEGQGQTWPGCVIPTSRCTLSRSSDRGSKYAAKKHIPRFADNHIVQSSGNVKMVIGIKMEQDKSKNAIVSVWCPKFIERSEAFSGRRDG